MASAGAVSVAPRVLADSPPRSLDGEADTHARSLAHAPTSWPNLRWSLLSPRQQNSLFMDFRAMKTLKGQEEGDWGQRRPLPRNTQMIKGDPAT